MKKIISVLAVIICGVFAHAQWSPILTLQSNDFFIDISAASNNRVWIIAQNNSSRNFIIYNTSNGGGNWKRILPNGFAQNIRALQLYAINATSALLSVNIDFTGVGPGIIYRTSDSGNNWTQVFSHSGNCEIKMGMFDKSFGLMSCSFSNGDGSHRAQELYYTKDGGNNWKLDAINPSNDFRITNFLVNGTQVAMNDSHYFYYSSNKGFKWSKQKLPLFNGSFNHLQFEDSSYAIVNEGPLINLFVKHPGSINWINLGNPTSMPGAITAIVLDSSECWFSMGFDTRNNYYSKDSAKTFIPFIADSLSGFLMMTKARKGSAVFGTTYGIGGRLWVDTRNHQGSAFSSQLSAIGNQSSGNKRRTCLLNGQESNVKQTIIVLEQNIPNPFYSTTTINYTLPQLFSSAQIIIIDKSGKTLKQINISGSGKGMISINAAELASGAYQYTLIVDGKIMGSKPMILTK